MKKITLAIIVLGFVLLVLGCSQAVEEKVDTELPPAEATPTESSDTPRVIKEGAYPVVIVDNKFNPADLEVKVSNEVEWVNRDNTTHTVSFENGDVDEKLVSGGTFGYTFTEKGEFRYFCSLHPGMQGSVIVS